jgi:hypothetical protein
VLDISNNQIADLEDVQVFGGLRELKIYRNPVCMVEGFVDDLKLKVKGSSLESLMAIEEEECLWEMLY